MKKEMNDEDRLKYFNSLQYNINLKKRDKKYYLSISEISLIVVNDSLQAGYEELANEKERFFKDMILSGCGEDIALPRSLSKRNELFSQLKIFICKLLILSFIFVVSCAFGGRLIMNKITSISGMDIARKVVKNVVFQVDEFVNTPEEKQKERIRKIKDFLNKLKPIIDEFKRESFPENSERPDK